MGRLSIHSFIHSFLKVAYLYDVSQVSTRINNNPSPLSSLLVLTNSWCIDTEIVGKILQLTLEFEPIVSKEFSTCFVFRLDILWK